MSQVFANKYRPRSLSEIIGQPVIVQTLTNAFNNKRLHHAYLFEGQLGSGKTSLGRILAAMENCQNGPTLVPCGKCNLCAPIFEGGKHTDIVEIDAASGAGKVEQIREIKREAQYNPVNGARVKYFILDEIHSASYTAMDSLLKILEEPPPRVRFVLCTTEVHKLRPAIQSRCQKHTVRKIYWTQITEHLMQIAKTEKFGIEQGAAILCAKMADGSMRNGLQNLENLLDFVGQNNLTELDAQKMFGSVVETEIYDLIDKAIGLSCSKVDSSDGFCIINKMLLNGASFDSIYEEITEALRKILVGLTCTKAKDFISGISSEGKVRLTKQLTYCHEKKLLPAVLKSMDGLQKAKQSVDYKISSETALQFWFVESIINFRSNTT